MADRKYLVIDSESEDDELEVGEVVVPQTVSTEKDGYMSQVRGSQRPVVVVA